MSCSAANLELMINDLWGKTWLIHFTEICGSIITWFIHSGSVFWGRLIYYTVLRSVWFVAGCFCFVTVNVCSFNSCDLPKGVPHLFLYCHLLCSVMSHGPSLHSDMSQAVVSAGAYSSDLTKPCVHPNLLACLQCLMCAHIWSTDSWKHISVAEEVEVLPVLSSNSWVGRRAREGSDQHSLCWDQTSQGTTQDSSHADGGALCFRSVLPANQRAQCHEKVIPLPKRSKAIKKKKKTIEDIKSRAQILHFFLILPVLYIYDCYCMLEAMENLTRLRLGFICPTMGKLTLWLFTSRVFGTFKNTNDRETVYAWFTFSHWLIYANSAANPIIYNFLSGKCLAWLKTGCITAL